MYELWIKNRSGIFVLADMGNDPPAINININNISDLATISTNATQQLKLPKSYENLKIFELIQDHTVISDLRHKLIECRLYDDNYTLFGIGSTLRILSINDTINVMLVGSEKSFFNQLKSTNQNGEPKGLNDIAFGASIIRGIDGIRNSKPSLNPNIFFAIANFSTDPKGEGSLYKTNDRLLIYDIAGQMPFIKLKYIIDTMLLDNGGYTLESDILDDVEYKDACIPFNSIKPNFNGLFNNYYCLNGDDSFPQRMQNNTVIGVNFISDIPTYNSNPRSTEIWNSVQLTSSISGGVIPFRTIKFISGSAGTYKFRVTCNIYSSILNDKLSPIIKIIKNTTDVNDLGIERYEGVITNNANVTFEFGVSLENTDFIMFIFMANPDPENEPGTRAFYLNNFRIEITDYFPAGDATALINMAIPVKSNLPAVSQSDFFKEFLKTYGLMLQVNEAEKKVRAYTFNYINNRKSVAKDWSNKYQMDSGTLKFVIDGFSYKNTLRYKTEEISTDKENTMMQVHESVAMYIYNKNTGEIYFKATPTSAAERMLSPTFLSNQDSYYISSYNFTNLNINDAAFMIADDETLAPEKNLFELIFEATAYQDGSQWTTPVSPIAPVANIPRLQYNAENIKASTFQYDKNPKLLIAYGNRQQDLSFRIFGETVSGEANNNPLKYVAPLTDAGASVQAQALINKYYNVLRDNILTDMRFIEDAEFYLTTQDISGFDPFTPVYVSNFGSYFYVNKIKNFTEGKLTKVDLVKI